LVGEPSQEHRERILVRRAVRQLLVDERPLSGVLGGEMHLMADAGALTLAQQALPRGKCRLGRATI
jgi:hypothetical protein